MAGFPLANPASTQNPYPSNQTTSQRIKQSNFQNTICTSHSPTHQSHFLGHQQQAKPVASPKFQSPQWTSAAHAVHAARFALSQVKRAQPRRTKPLFPVSINDWIRLCLVDPHSLCLHNHTSLVGPALSCLSSPTFLKLTAVGGAGPGVAVVIVLMPLNCAGRRLVGGFLDFVEGFSAVSNSLA